MIPEGAALLLEPSLIYLWRKLGRRSHSPAYSGGMGRGRPVVPEADQGRGGMMRVEQA